MAEPLNLVAPRKLSVKDAVAWLEEKSPTAKCPMCNSDRWTILSDEDEAAVVGYKRMSGDPSTLQHWKPVFQLECVVCAFIAAFSVTVVLQWLDGKKAAAQDESDGKL